MKKKKSLLTIFQLHVFVLVLSLVCVLGYLWMSMENDRSEAEINKIRTSYLTSEKKQIKSDVQDVLQYIQHQKSLAISRVKKFVKSRTVEAFQTALYIYEQNKNSMPQEKIKDLIRDTLFAASWDSGNGYYFVEKPDGKEIVNHSSPEITDRDIVDLQDDDGNFIVQDILKQKLPASAEGFISFYWHRPDAPEMLEPRVSYIKYFEPFNWIIGNGMYVEDEKEIIKNEILEWIEKTHPRIDNYIFTGTWDGLSLTGPAKGKNMYNLVAPDGMKVVQELIRTAKKGGGYLEYTMPALSNMRQALKISYVAPVEEWEWYIGTGVYVDYIEDLVIQKQQTLKETFRSFLKQSLLVLTFLCLFSFALTHLLSKKIERNIRLFLDFFKDSAQKALPIPLDQITFKEFHSLATSANQMAKERQYAWDSLKENQNYLRSIFNSPNEAIIIFDPHDGSILDVNQAMVKMYHITTGEAVTPLKENIIFGPSPYSYKEIFEKIIDTVTGGPQTFEWLAKKKTGETFWTEISLNLTELGDKSFVIAVQRDIDAKKKAEQVLAAEQERLAVTLRSIGDGVITTNTEGKIVLINKTAEQITGWTAEEALGRQATTVFNIMNERTGKLGERPAEQIAESNRLVKRTSQRVLITKAGHKVPIADSGAPICDKESKIIGVVLVFRDITNERKTEQELLKIRKLESVGVLAGGIAHDFNNILSAILGNIELASKIVGKDHKVSSLLSDAISATFRASKLTQQLLTFAKGGEPIKETTALPDIVKESAEFVLHGSNITCTYDCPDDLWYVNVDSGQIGQVIQNIILNARHAMPDGGKIEVKGTNIWNPTGIPLLEDSKGKYIKIEVRDSGIGIPGDFIDKIFDPYFSTKQEGSGLGLAISHSIITKHNGSLSAESTPGKGSLFTIYLPATTEPTKQMENDDDVPVSTRAATVMIMDDEEVVRNVTKSQLEFFGHQVILVSDGIEAITVYRKRRESGEPVDVIIMDLTIPGGMGGREAVTAILREDPQAKVIVSSGYSTDPVMAEYRKYGFRAALTKPIVIEELKKAILSVL